MDIIDNQTPAPGSVRAHRTPSMTEARSPHPTPQSGSAPSSATKPVREAFAACFEICFASLFRPGRGLGFPCDASGGVDVDALPQAARRNYLAALAGVGTEYALPEVRPVDCPP